RGRDEDLAPYRVSKTKLLATARALLDRGWRVEIDGRLHRRASSLSVGVSSGVDWFDVRLRADFDGALVPFPELLAALRERRRTVVLADGSLGELPDEWTE